MTGLMELGRASWWHTNFLRAMGARMGRGVYWDVSAFSVRPSTLRLNPGPSQRAPESDPEP